MYVFGIFLFYIRTAPRLLIHLSPLIVSTKKQLHQSSILFRLPLSLSSLPLPPLLFSSFNGSDSGPSPLSLGGQLGGFSTGIPGGGGLGGGSPSCVRGGGCGDSDGLGRGDPRIKRSTIRGFFDCLGRGEFGGVSDTCLDRCPGLGVDD
jgi:hypothetical protein